VYRETFDEGRFESILGTSKCLYNLVGPSVSPHNEILESAYIEIASPSRLVWIILVLIGSSNQLMYSLAFD
jgi:hypothetical protein